MNTSNTMTDATKKRSWIVSGLARNFGGKSIRPVTVEVDGVDGDDAESCAGAKFASFRLTGITEILP